VQGLWLRRWQLILGRLDGDDGVSAILASRDKLAGFADTIHATPRVEKYSSKAMTHAYAQLQRLIGNMDKTSSSLQRIRKVISRLLGDTEVP
jgi:hypothetical protein